MSDREYLLALASFVPFGPAHLNLLTKFFGSAKKAWEATTKDLVKMGMKPEKAQRFANHRKTFSLKNYLAKLAQLNINFITESDSNYPENLKGIDAAPKLLYVIGELLPQDANAVAIVGSRKMTYYGREVAQKFASELASLGVTIISGLARGIDTAAHEAALEAGGRTIAVIGCGLDRIYPLSNTRLAERLVKNGAVLSEYPLGYSAFKENFAARNRIVSGLSKAVIVVEGQERSGTLLTANAAAIQGKTVFAVPGQITSPLSAAPHYLIKNGAKFAFDTRDVLDELNLQLSVDIGALRQALPEAKEETLLWELLEREPLHLDELVRISKLSSSLVVSTLSMMELRGLVRNVGGGVYKRG